jgi:ABC-type uncharacterized transport system substrate-binding protein
MKRVAFLSFVLVLAIGSSFSHAAMNYRGKKLLHIDSYGIDYIWSETLTKGIYDVIQGTGIEFKRFEMNTKNFKTEEDKQKAAAKAKELIDSYHPDIVIVSDDNAVQYVLQKYYKDSKIPFVFCGVNWDAKKYGLPYANTTGMLEVEYIQPLYNLMRKYAKGGKIGFIGGDTETDRFTANFYKENFFHENMTKTYFAKDFEEFKKMFVQAQSEVDMLYFNNAGSVKGWKISEMTQMVRTQTKIPMGSNGLTEAPYSLVTFGKFGKEQGEWAAEAALKILGGVAPTKIDIAKNAKIRFVVNRELADKLQVVFDLKIFRLAEMVRIEDAEKGYNGIYKEKNRLKQNTISTVRYDGK